MLLKLSVYWSCKYFKPICFNSNDVKSVHGTRYNDVPTSEEPQTKKNQRKQFMI